MSDADFAPRFIEAKAKGGSVRLRVATFDAAPGVAPRGVCVLVNGQTEYIEKYFEVIGELCSKGFAVATMDWRGQGGSARLLPDPLKAHIGDFADYDADLDALMAQVVDTMGDGPRIGLAHSMGGHNLLRALHARPDMLKAAVFSAPMIAVSSRGQPRMLVRLVTAWKNLGTRATDFVWGMEKRDPLTMTFADQIVTSDRARFARSQEFLKAHPELRLAGPTWGWVGAAFRSMAAMNMPSYAPAITTPVLICGAGKDRICLTPAAARLARLMPNGEFQCLDDAEHEILMENDSIRARFWAAFDGFIASQNI